MSAICPHAALELIPRIARPGAVEPGYSSPCQLIDRALSTSSAASTRASSSYEGPDECYPDGACGHPDRLVHRLGLRALPAHRPCRLPRRRLGLYDGGRV